MGSSPPWLARVAEALGPVGPPTSLGGAWAVSAGGRDVVVKTGPSAADEFEGLRRLASVAAYRAQAEAAARRALSPGT